MDKAQERSKPTMMISATRSTIQDPETSKNVRKSFEMMKDEKDDNKNFKSPSQFSELNPPHPGPSVMSAPQWELFGSFCRGQSSPLGEESLSPECLWCHFLWLIAHHCG